MLRQSNRPVSLLELYLTAAILLLEILLLLRAFRQRGALRLLTPRDAPFGAPEVAVIVPARNEAANIGACLNSLTQQSYPRLSIIAVDDESEDGTAEIVAAIARRNPSVTLLKSGPLQAGWTGKTQACWRGANAAPPEAEWFCFIDADMRAEPLLVASAVAEAQLGLDLLSLAPRHRLLSFAERLMIPCGLYLLGFRQDLAKVQSARSGEASVTGQFMLIRLTAYLKVGGHAAVAGAICEDLELGRLLKRSGFTVLMMDGSRQISSRMYSGWSTLWPGFAKNVIDMFGGARSTLATATAAFLLSWCVVVLPFADAANCMHGSPGGCVALGLAVAAAGAAVGFHVAGAAFLGVPIWYGILFPVGYTVGGLIALDGLRRRSLGRISWKGRIYP